MIACGAVLILLGLLLMGYQRIGWPRSDIFAAGSLLFTILCFVAAALAIPGMPHFFNLDRKSDSTTIASPAASPVNDPQVVPQAGKLPQDVSQYRKEKLAPPQHPKLSTPLIKSDAQPQPTLGSVNTQSTQAVAQSSPSQLVKADSQQMQENSQGRTNPYNRIGELHQRMQNLSYEWSGALQRIDQDRARPYKMGLPGPMPAQLPVDLAQRLKDLDEQYGSQYANLDMEIAKAHQDAVSYMNLTPNEGNYIVDSVLPLVDDGGAE